MDAKVTDFGDSGDPGNSSLGDPGGSGFST